MSITDEKYFGKLFRENVFSRITSDKSQFYTGIKYECLAHKTSFSVYYSSIINVRFNFVENLKKMNANLLSRITINIEQCGGKPCIRNIRIRVSDVLDLLANGISPEQIVTDELPDLELQDIYACFAFASAKLNHPILQAA